MVGGFLFLVWFANHFSKSFLRLVQEVEWQLLHSKSSAPSGFSHFSLAEYDHRYNPINTTNPMIA
jgi:hypothetical protein